MLEFNDLTLGFTKGPVILDYASGRFDRGQINLLIGVNGIGKTTFLRALSGDCTHIISGEVIVDGTSISSVQDYNRMVTSSFSEDDFISERFSGREFLQSLVLLRNSEDRSALLIEALGLESFVDKRIEKYSFGMRQLLRVAGACQSSARVLILDEPFNGLDVVKCHLVSKFLDSLARSGFVVIVSSHQFLSLSKYPCRNMFMDTSGLTWGGDDTRPMDYFNLD